MKRVAVSASLLLATACIAPGDDPAPAADAATPDPTPDGAAPAPDAAPAADPDDLPTDYRFLCDVAPPTGAPAPPSPPAYSGGECPELVVGRNSIQSGGVTREFILVAPTDMTADESLPLVFLWHQLGTGADAFLDRGILQAGADEDRFLAVLPEAKSDLWTEWPWGPFDRKIRLEEELQFFDDMLACVTQQLAVNRQCIGNGGVSTGGMWNAVLTSKRSEYLASSITVSGGVGEGVTARRWGGATHKLPMLLIWGGESDVCSLYDFDATSLALEQALDADGHAVVECVHNCGHSLPPFEAMTQDVSEADAGKVTLRPVWRFVLDHPYWLSDGNSPYRWHGIPEAFPGWCDVGADSAVPRTGECTQPNACAQL